MLTPTQVIAIVAGTMVLLVLIVLIFAIVIGSAAAHHNLMDEENKKNKRNERIKIQEFKHSKIKTSIFKTQNNETIIRGKLKEKSIEASFSMLVEYHTYEEVLEIYGLD